LEMIEKKHEAEKAAAPVIPETEHEADNPVAAETEPEAIEADFDSVPIPDEGEVLRYSGEHEPHYVSLEEAEAGAELGGIEDLS
jgi:hypothetical protein